MLLWNQSQYKFYERFLVNCFRLNASCSRCVCVSLPFPISNLLFVRNIPHASISCANAFHNIMCSIVHLRIKTNFQCVPRFTHSHINFALSVSVSIFISILHARIYCLCSSFLYTCTYIWFGDLVYSNWLIADTKNALFIKQSAFYEIGIYCRIGMNLARVVDLIQVNL